MVRSNFGRIGIAWTILCAGGIYAFILSKNSIEQRRYEDMQIRERMKKSNVGEYEPVGERKFSA